MSEMQQSAQLILKLYELRREEKLRAARDWFASFVPTSAAEVLEAWRGEHNAKYRMVTSYWDMAATLVNHGGIDADMFNDAGAEHVFVYVKLEPFLAEIRGTVGAPTYLASLEKVIKGSPAASARLVDFRARVEKMKEAKAAAKA